MLKKAISVFTIACMLTSVLSFNVFAQNKTSNQNSNRFDTSSNIDSKDQRRPGQIIIKYKNNEALKANKNFIIKNQGKIIKFQDNGLALVEVNDEKLSEKIRIFRQNKNVEYVVPNYIRRVVEFPEDAPNDPEYENQWALKNINAQEAWIRLKETSPLEEVKVAVIDTGLDTKHEDLKDRVCAGYDFVDMDEDPSHGPYNEEHASHVAGIIAASTNNEIGVAGTAGIAPVKIMPLRVLEAGSGDDYTIAQAIYYAADKGAKVINMSLGGYGESPLLTNACNYAFSKGVVVVAAAGNNGADTENYTPASIPGVITVAATDSNNETAYFSNFGSHVELAAPGVDVLSTLPGNKYEAYSGTSMSTPFVSAAAALLISKNPKLSIIEVEQYLTDSSKDLGESGKDTNFGYGLLDLDGALKIKEIKPRLEITNLSDKSTVYDVINVQTRYTYPERIVNTNLYIDNILIEPLKPVEDETVIEDEIIAENEEDSVANAVYENKMYTNFELDTNKFVDGLHTLKVVAEDNDEQTYTKEIKINIRNKVYTGLRVKVTNEGEPVKNGYVEVYNKYELNGETYYNYIYSGSTSSNGVAIIPGTVAPNGNDYIIVANYEIKNGDQYSYASEVLETTAPGIIEMDGTGLVPVTVDIDVDDPFPLLFTSYKFPGSETSFSFFMMANTDDGQMEVYLNPGSYSFQAICMSLPMDEIIGEDGDNEFQRGSIYLLYSGDVEVDSDNSYIVIDSDISNLADVDVVYENIHGFIPQGGSIGFSLVDSNLSCGFGVDDMSNLYDVYLTPGNYICSMDITGQKDNQLAYVALESSAMEFESESENIVNFGGTLTGKIGVAKTKYIPGEELYIEGSITDSYDNKLLFMDYIYDDMYSLLNGQNIITYKTGPNKAQIRSLDSIIKALEEPEKPEEPEEPEEPIEIEYKSPATLSLVDSKGNEIIKQELYYLDSTYMVLPQNLATDKYKLKLVVDVPYLIQTETSFNVSRVVKSNAVKFTIDQADKTKAKSATVEAIDTQTGMTYYFDGVNLLNGEMFVPLPKGNYKFVVNVATYKENGIALEGLSKEQLSRTVSDDVYEVPSIVMNNTFYVKDGKSPANYSLSSSQLQKIDFTVKDEAGKLINKPAGYFLSIPFGTSTYSALLGMDIDVLGIKISMGDVYVNKGNYNFSTEVISEDISSTERIIFKPDVSIGLKTKNTQLVEFTSDNLTEVSLDSKSDKRSIEAVISDTKAGFTSSLTLMKNKPVKVSKGLYEMDILCESNQYGNTYVYVLNSQKDFTSDNTVINCGTDFSMSIKPNKSIYRAGETLKTTNVISDRYGNRVVDIYSDSYYMYFSEILKSSKGRVILKKVNGEIKPYDIVTREYIEIPYYDIRAPFIFIKDSFNDVIFSAKSPDFYTNSSIKLDSQWIDSGNYNIELTLDIDADGNMSAESPFRVK